MAEARSNGMSTRTRSSEVDTDMGAGGMSRPEWTGMNSERAGCAK